MKSFLPGFLFIFSSLNGFTQSFHFIENGSGNAAQSAYTRQVADSTGDEFILHCLNSSASLKSVKVRMTVLATPDGCSNDVFFCDPIACYPASVHLSIAPFGIGAGDTTMGALVPHIDPGFCCGDYAVNYCLFDVNNEGDSVNVMVYYNVGGNHCTNGIGEINDGAFLSIAYPDPAAGHLAIHYSYAEQVNRASLEFYDLSGRKQIQYDLENNQGAAEIDTSPLRQGIYFYALRINDKLTGFKKLIITR